MLPDRRIFQASVRNIWGGSLAHNTLGSFVCLWRAGVSERRDGSESETCTDGWPPCMGFCHLLASCCPPFTCFPVFLRGRGGSSPRLAGSQVCSTTPDQAAPRANSGLTSIHSEPQQNNAATAFHFTITHTWTFCSCKCYIPKCFFSPFLKEITAFSHCILKVVLQWETDPGMSVSTPSTQTVWLKTSPALQISSKQHDRRTQPQRGMLGHVGNTTRQAQGQCVKQYTHANTLPLILPKLIKIVNCCTFIQTSAEFWGAPSELDNLFLAFFVLFSRKISKHS